MNTRLCGKLNNMILNNLKLLSLLLGKKYFLNSQMIIKKKLFKQDLIIAKKRNNCIKFLSILLTYAMNL